MALSDKDRAYYAAMQVTFDTPGWQLIKDGWLEEIDRIPEQVFFNAKAMDDVYSSRVRYHLLRELLDLEAQLGQQLADREAEEEEETREGDIR